MRIINIGKSIIIILILLFSIFLSGCISNNNTMWGDAPDFTLSTIDNKTFTLSDHFGNIIVIDLMATWCPPCQLQMGELEKIVNEYENEVVVVSVDIDLSETINDIIDTFGDYVNKWTFVLDNNEEKVGEAYQVSSIPKLVIIDKKGNIYYTHVGYMEYSALSTKINGLLG